MRIRNSPLALATSAFALALFSPATLAAQDSATSVLTPGFGVLPPAMKANSDLPDIQAPPRAVAQVVQKHTMPAVPIGRPTWDVPQGPPLMPGQSTAGPTAATVQVYRNAIVRPAGSNWSSVGEPSVSKLDNVNGYLHTGNWYAANSTNGGATWSSINPYTLFGAVDAGFCCDQATIAHQGAAITVWLLQYSFSATTNRGSFMLGIGPDAHTANFGYRLDPTSFGFPAGNWFDFPHLAVSNDFVYLASNVFSGGGPYQGAVVARFNAAQLRTGGNVNFSYFRSDSATLPANTFGSARFALGIPGSTPTMYWASHVSTTSLRIFAWPDSGSMTVRDRAIGTWYSGNTPAPGPDGRDWTGRHDSRINGGYQGAQGTMGWAWISNAGGAFPRTFVRLVRFDSNFALYGESSAWNPTIAYAYASLAPSPAGHIGGTICGGGGTFFPHTLAVIMDDLNGWGFSDNNYIVAGNSGPATSIWGDYFWTQYIGGNKWVGTGFAQVGGSANANAEHHNADFGRTDLSNPVTRNLNIASSPVAGATFALNVYDFGLMKDGVTSAVRTFRNGNAVQVTAATTLGSRPFYRWLIGSTGQPVGQRTLALTMSSNQSITAVYGTQVTGTYTAYGTGCPGTSNQVPVHSGGGTPEIGRLMNWDINHVIGNTAGTINFGTRGAPIPLTFLGMGTCTLDVTIASVFSVSLNGAGLARLQFSVPNDTSLINARVATQGAVFDPGAPTPTKVVQTAGLETRVGGFQQ